MPKPSTPQLEEEFTVVLRNLEQRHAVRMLAISKGFQEFMTSTGAQYKSNSDGGCTTATKVSHDTGRWTSTIDPQMDKEIQTFFDQLYTIHLGTRLLIGKSSPLFTPTLLTNSLVPL
jgi:pyruvate dehydrogenase kinase 2/3/4